MIHQLTIGIAIIVITIVLQALLLATATKLLRKVGPWLVRPPFDLKNAISLAGLASWLVLGMAVEVGIWAMTFQTVGAFDSFEPSLYFSLVTFTTLGYGDIVLDANWRLLAGLAAADGLIIFGLNTAFMIEFSSRVHQAQETE